MKEYNRFEATYSTLMDKTLSIELKDDTFTASYVEDGGIIKSETISKKQYANLLQEIRYRMKLSVNAIYIPETLNCFIEGGVLYLDEALPFSTQMKVLDDLKVFFYFEYKRIKYNGPLSFSEKLFNIGSLIKNEEHEDKTNAIKANIKMNLTKLDITFKNYVEKRIKEIYLTPEELLKSITDLTKPIDDLGSFNVQDELQKLSEQIEKLVETTNYIKKIEIERQALTSNAEKDLKNSKIKAVFESQINEAYQEQYNIIKTNAINEIEGKEYKEIEEISSDFKNKIDAILKLLTEYYAKNISIFELIYGDEGNQEIIIARINTIYSFYGMLNPYTETINDFKNKIKTSLKNQQDCTALVEEYNSFLENALMESEDKAFRLCIECWKKCGGSNINQALTINNPILTKIGEEVDNYNKAIKEYAEYKRSKKTEYINLGKDKAEKETYEYYMEYYQEIINKIEKIHDKDNDNSISPVNKDSEYEKLLSQLQALTSRVQNDLKYIQIHNSIQNLLNNNMTNEIVGDDPFNLVFEKVSSANYGIHELESFTADVELFNYSVVKKFLIEYDTEYKNILKRVSYFYENKEKKDEEEFKKIIIDLDNLIDRIERSCRNENELINRYNYIAEQKKIM